MAERGNFPIPIILDKGAGARVQQNLTRLINEPSYPLDDLTAFFQLPNFLDAGLQIKLEQARYHTNPKPIYEMLVFFNPGVSVTPLSGTQYGLLFELLKPLATDTKAVHITHDVYTMAIAQGQSVQLFPQGIPS